MYSNVTLMRLVIKLTHDFQSPFARASFTTDVKFFRGSLSANVPEGLSRKFGAKIFFFINVLLVECSENFLSKSFLVRKL